MRRQAVALELVHVHLVSLAVPDSVPGAVKRLAGVRVGIQHSRACPDAVSPEQPTDVVLDFAISKRWDDHDLSVVFRVNIFSASAESAACMACCGYPERVLQRTAEKHDPWGRKGLCGRG